MNRVVSRAPVPTAPAGVGPAPPSAVPLTGIAAESAAALGAQAAAVAAAKRPPQRTDLVRLGYVDDLGFFVNDSDGDGRHDLCTPLPQWRGASS